MKEPRDTQPSRSQGAAFGKPCAFCATTILLRAPAFAHAPKPAFLIDQSELWLASAAGEVPIALVKVVDIDSSQILDWDTFHGLFRDVIGFPEFYGMNMNAFIDCMGYIDSPDAQMTTITTSPGETLLLNILDVDSFQRRCPAQFQELVSAIAFVNYRKKASSNASMIALSFYA